MFFILGFDKLHARSYYSVDSHPMAQSGQSTVICEDGGQHAATNVE
jgi:hypothetical protein